MTPARRVRTAGLLALLVLAPATTTAAQDIRVTGTTSVRYIRLRPLVPDSVPVSATRGTGLVRRTVDGRVVRCIQGQPWCHLMTPTDPVAAVPVLQDLEVNVWGLGRGVRAYAHLRGRGVGGGGEVAWSRPDDAFDPLAAWVELDRSRLRVRAGRQWTSSGLGFYNFDGASILVRTFAGLSFEAFGGRPLIRGANETRTGGALASVESLAPSENDLLVGGRVAWRPGPSRSLVAHYQREIRQDRYGLHAERASLDGVWRLGRWQATTSVEVDLAQRDLSELLLRGDVHLQGGAGASVAGRRHRPWFEAWTIWGAFDPVGFDEVGGRVWWRPPSRPVSLEVGGAWRRYPEAHASTTFGTFRDTGWRLSATGGWTLAPGWRADARLGTDLGFGAASSDAWMRLERQLGERGWVALSTTAFDRQYEFRVADGRVWGVGVDGGLTLASRASIRADVAAYRHKADADLPGPDWSQLRGSLLLRWTVGAEPGTTRGGGP